MKRKNVKGLALTNPPAKPPTPSAGDSQIPGAIGNVQRQDTLEIGVEFKLDLRSEDLVVIKELGAGNGGTVSKVIHAATKVVMAKKVNDNLPYYSLPLQLLILLRSSTLRRKKMSGNRSFVNSI